jgi:UDP-N-acetylmuramate dehydrogenase
MKSQPHLKIQQNILLAPYTTFKIGGPARYFVEARDEEELLEAIRFAQENNLEIFILGGGSNILVNDDGFDGLVIHIQNTKYQIQNTTMQCDAGLPLSEAVRLAKENSLTGLEWAAGIPGTVGGAIRGNAGAYGGTMGEITESVRFLDINTELICVASGINSEECKFCYRDSIFKQNKNLIILSATIKLQKGDKSAIENKIKDIIKQRAEKLPKSPSAGSFFLNPIVKDKELIARFEREKGLKCRDNTLPAGWLIAEVGLRGKQIGGAAVSQEHANFVVNLGSATAQDVLAILSFVKMKVRDELGVQLREEIKYVGF